jgi:di/tricarboxylate transporter
MKRSRVALVGLLLFSLYTLFTLLTAEQSLLAFGRELMSRPDTAQVVIDLYLMALLAGVWMYRDARRRGRSLASLVPYFVLTAVFVSVGPLLYLVVNGLEPFSEKTG